MALTPEDVVNKRFQHVKFREGYDQDEVDDFLDEIVVELRRLYTENDDLRQKLSAAEAKVEELQSKKGAAPAPAAAAPKEEKKTEAASASAAPASAAKADDASSADAKDAKDEAPAKEAPKAAPAPAAAAAPSAAPSAATASAAAASSTSGDDKDAHGLIALAQRVHDEHIAEGERERDKLVSEAEKKASAILSSAEKKRDETLSQLEDQKASLEREIDGLQNFERQYRTRLKSYLSDQLRDLESSGTLAPETLSGNKMGGSSNTL